MRNDAAPPWAMSFADGTVIPAHPLALDASLNLDETRQRALTRYYHDAGAGGLAVGVHTTQFAIREPRFNLYKPVLRIAADTMAEFSDRDSFIAIAGVSGSLEQAVAEAELAATIGYHAVLLSPNATEEMSEHDLLERTRAVGQTIPVIGFYLQPAVGGRILSESYWTRLADIESVIGVKLAPFNRYHSLEAVRGISLSGRAQDITLYTGNDDSIVLDLLSTFHTGSGDQARTMRFAGGLLGQWAIWTKRAVELLQRTKQAHNGDDGALRELLAMAADLTDANSAVFDAANNFAGSIAGINEILCRQGMLAGNWCLEERECLSPGQSEELDRVTSTYTQLVDDNFIAENLDRWLA